MDNVQITFHPMTSEAGGANPVLSPVFDVSGFANLTLFLNVEDISGAGANIHADIQDSMDGQNWHVAGPLDASSVGVTTTNISNMGRFVRARYTYTGTDPQVTFSLLGLAREF